MTKEQFLRRCENAFDMGIASDNALFLMERWTDFVLRFENTMLSNGQTQGRMLLDFIESAKHRHYSGAGFLAGDVDGYALIRFAAILNHPCQLCAEDPRAWHTRTAFCEHRKVSTPAATTAGQGPR